MIWLAFSAKGKTDLVVMTGKQNSVSYCNILREQVVPLKESAHTEKLVFQQDNAAIHASRYTISFLENKDIELME